MPDAICCSPANGKDKNDPIARHSLPDEQEHKESDIDSSSQEHNGETRNDLDDSSIRNAYYSTW